MNIALISPSADTEMPMYSRDGADELTVAVASLSIGGAERIVLDWAARIHPRWRVHLIVLRNRDQEWKVPPFVRVTRIENNPRFASLFPVFTDLRTQRTIALTILSAEIARSAVPVCVCHLLSKPERDALGASGATIINVLHNAKAGWGEDAEKIDPSVSTIAVSEACAKDLREVGFEGPVTVIRHLPSKRLFADDSREKFRQSWNIPQDALVIGMVGAVKAQKNYSRALRIFKSLLKKRDAYLVIVGGPVNIQNEGRRMWEKIVADVESLGIRHRVAMPGFIPDATQCLGAFDLILNTSDFEGLSIATLEALQAGLPVVASKVGGQGEISSPGLSLISLEEPEAVWVDTITEQLGRTFDAPEWSRFPSYRLWTLAGLARPFEDTGKTLFVTSNLNSGGAQRSLVNLATYIEGRADFEVAVMDRSSNPYFTEQLLLAGVRVMRMQEKNDVFFHTEMLIHKICSEGFGRVVFWNLDPRVKILLVKMLGWTSVKFIDVSPGGYAFEEMGSDSSFQHLVAFSTEDYEKRLDTLVLKYDGPYPPLCEGKVVVIRNGVPRPPRMKDCYEIKGAPRVVVNGRIASSKFMKEIVEAMRLVQTEIPNAELHIYGGVEAGQRDYFDEVWESTKGDPRFVWYGFNYTCVEKLHEYDAYVVLGKHQGCPNALLEALAVGMPSVGNDDGGTREQVIDGVTGLLVSSTDPTELASALIKILSDRQLSKELGEAGRAHVERQFSMREMTEKYLQLLNA